MTKNEAIQKALRFEAENTRYREVLKKIASNKYAAFTCLDLAREALGEKCSLGLDPQDDCRGTNCNSCTGMEGK